MAQNIELLNVTAEKGEGGLVNLQVEVAPSSVQQMRERVIKDFSKRLRVPGFRPGNIPANIVRRNVGDEAIAQEINERIVPEAYQAALEKSGVQPLERAQVDELSFDAFDGEKPLTFVARVVARPEITLGELEGLKATKQTINISDEDVDTALERMREERAYLVNVHGRGAADGDVLFADLQVYLDGETRSEEPAKLRGFVLGQSGFVPEIDGELTGMEMDETRRFNVKYPDDFRDEELAGKDAEFEAKITAIKERVVPEVTDEFAQIAGADDVADLKSRLHEFLTEAAERESRKAAREELVKAASEGATLELPTALLETRLQERVENIKQQLAQNGAPLESYLENIGSTKEQMETDLREELETELKQELVLDEIATRQELPVTMPEIENHYVLMAQVMEQPVEQLVENVPVANVRTSILQRKAIDWLAEKAVITDQDGNPVSLNVPAMQDEASEAAAEGDDDELIPLGTGEAAQA